MRVCQDCGKEIGYGKGFNGGGNVCARCRAKRAHASAKRNAELAGKTWGGKKNRDPLDVLLGGRK